jgi:RNA polymerase sigma-70 factor (ECF subfamily)
LQEETEISELLQKADFDQAFKLIVSSQKKAMYVHIYRMLGNHADTDDALQETFIRVWRHLEKFNGDSKLSTWVYRIATNVALTQLEKEKKRKTIPLTNVEIPISEGLAPTAAEIQMKLTTAMELLPPKQKQVFIMRYYDELSYQDIANITGTSEGALKASYHHAVKKIEASLQAD